MMQNSNSQSFEMSQTELLEIFHSAQVGFFIVDVKGPGKYAYAGMNRYHEQLTGIECNEIMGKSPADLIDFFGDEAVGYIIQLYDHVCRTAKSAESVREVTIQGKPDWWLTRLVPVMNSEQKVIRLIGTSVIVTEHKQAEMALAESEKRYRLLTDNILDCIWVAKMDFTLIYINSIVEEMFGYKVEEMLGKSALAYMDPQCHDEVRELVQAALVRGTPSEGVTFEAVIQHRAGHHVHVEILGKVLWRDQQPVGIQGVTRDVTRRKKSERELLEKSVFLDKIIDTSTVSTWIADASGTAIRANSACLEFFGATEDEVIGKYNIFKDNIVLEKGLLPVIDSVFCEGIAANVHLEYDFGAVEHVDIENPKCKFINSIMTPVLNDRNKVTHVIMQTIDLTEIKHSEKLLKKEKEFTELALNAQQDLFILFNPKTGRAHRWNRMFQDLTGYSDPEISQRLFPDEYHKNSGHHRDQEFIREVNEQGYGTIELELLSKNGKSVPIEYRISRIDNHQDDQCCFVAVGRDISERKDAEMKQRNLEAQIRHVQKLESLGVLAGGIAHDFNNILMSILGNTDIAYEETPEHSPVRECLSEIEQATRRAADLCRQMLAYAGKGQYVIKSVSISEIAKEMAQMMGVAISKKIEMEYDLDLDLPFIDADPTQLRQIILNFITNASEAIGDSPGTISVKTYARNCDERFFEGSFYRKTMSPGCYVLLEVSDTGCGMTPDTVERVFDPFFSTKFTGRGLGLAAVLGIVRGHQGAIHVASQPDVGTTFRVSFPASKQTGKTCSKQVPIPRQLRGQPVILLVDDEPAILKIAQRMLNRLGCQVLTAENGLQAIDVYSENKTSIDCVMLDLTMPQLSGKETCQQLQQLNPDVKILFSSGYTQQELSGQELCTKYTAFIQKPYSMDRLADALLDILTD